MCAVLSHFSHVQLFATPWTVAHQAPPSMGFSRQEYWSGLPCPPSGDLPDPGIKPAFFTSPALAGGFFTTSATWEAHYFTTISLKTNPSQYFRLHFISPERQRHKVREIRTSHLLVIYLLSVCILLFLKDAAAAKSLQSCPTLCDPIDGSPPGSPVPGILQARTLEWVSISFSSA